MKLPVAERVLCLALIPLTIWAACAGRPEPAPPQAETRVFQEVFARRRTFMGMEARGELTVKHQTQSITVPFEITISKDLRIEVKGEVSHFLLPFKGEFKLVSDSEATVLHTDSGVYDLTPDHDSQSAARAFLLSVAGGGDLLLWWLGEKDCPIAGNTACEGLEIELVPDGRLPSIGTWQIGEGGGGAVFKASVEEREPGTLLPRILTGTLYPDEMAVYLKYSDIRQIADLPG